MTQGEIYFSIIANLLYRTFLRKSVYYTNVRSKHLLTRHAFSISLQVWKTFALWKLNQNLKMFFFFSSVVPITFYVIFVMKTFLKDFSTSNLVVSTLYQMLIFKAGKTSLFRILIQPNLPTAIYISFVLFLRMHSLGVWNGNVNINKKCFFFFLNHI